MVVVFAQGILQPQDDARHLTQNIDQPAAERWITIIATAAIAEPVIQTAGPTEYRQPLRPFETQATVQTQVRIVRC